MLRSSILNPQSSILDLLSSSFRLHAFVSILVPVPIPVNAIGVFKHAFAEGVTVNAQSIGGLGKIVVMAAENFKNEALFKLLHGLVKENTASDHLVDNRFEFHFHRLPPLIADCGLRIADFLNLNRQPEIAKCGERNCRTPSVRNPQSAIRN